MKTGGRPVCKSRGADSDVIWDSRLYIPDFKEPIIVRRCRAAIAGDRALVEPERFFETWGKLL